MKLDREIVGTIGQYGSGILLAIGIGIETTYGAHIGFICISTGGLLWGLFTKIKGN